MARGLPVVAAGSGAHLETVGSVPGAALFEPGDADDAARLLRELADSQEERESYGARLQVVQRERFTVEQQARRTDAVYRELSVTDLVVVSLEAWDGVWRRNQHLVSRLLAADPDLRVLFVEPPADPLHDAASPVAASAAASACAAPTTGCGCFQPTKWLPRRLDPAADRRLSSAVVRAAGQVGMTRPVLWLNDPLAADLLRRTGWPALYDITDDWLLADRSPREHDRLVESERYLLDHCRQVVVCSPRLLETKSTRAAGAGDAGPERRGRRRLPGRRAAPGRPAPRPVVLYVGTLHRDRLDVDLCATLAGGLSGRGDLRPRRSRRPRRGRPGPAHRRRSRPPRRARAHHDPGVPQERRRARGAARRHRVHRQPRPDQGLRVPRRGPPRGQHPGGRLPRARGRPRRRSCPAATSSRATRSTSPRRRPGGEAGVPSWDDRAEAMRAVVDEVATP